jgi:hypothetical protein
MIIINIIIQDVQRRHLDPSRIELLQLERSALAAGRYEPSPFLLASTIERECPTGTTVTDPGKRRRLSF